METKRTSMENDNQLLVPCSHINIMRLTHPDREDCACKEAGVRPCVIQNGSASERRTQTQSCQKDK